MNNIQPIDPTRATGKTKQLFDTMKAKMGMIPNALRIIGNSPAALEGYLSLGDAVGESVLSPKTREQIFLAISEENGCSYCLSVHSQTSRRAGLSKDDILHARQGTGTDKKADSAVKFARKVSEERGKVDAFDLADVRKVGFTDAEIVEIVASVILISFTNYANNAFDPVIDFPIVKPGVFAPEGKTSAAALPNSSQGHLNV